MDVICPECEFCFDVWEHENWDEDSFEVECPACKAPLVIEVQQEVTYYYSAELDEERAEAKESKS